MMQWKKIYERTLKNLCESKMQDFETIVEQDLPKYSVDLVDNPNANEDSLYSFMLDENATENDYRNFVEYIYGYIGEDINDYLEKDNDAKSEGENGDMEENKIRTMLKRYGASDNEIENFMEDLANYKEDVQEDAEEEEEFSPYASDVVAKLKETDEGKELLMNAPKMEREKFIQAVKDYLAK